ncbi:MAG: DUF4175 family protein [Bacteroidota bacterium]
MQRPGDELIGKLDAFIRRYYRNELLRGGLFALGLLTSTIILAALLEYIGHFGTGVRMFLFFTCLASAAWIVAWYLIRPLLHLFRIGKVLSYEEAALIVGRHFPDVQDKLLNTLQLSRMYSGNSTDALLLAGIEQRTSALRPLPFARAVDVKRSLRLTRWVALPVLLIASLLLFQSHIITGPARRIVQYDRVFKREAPFRFVVHNPKLRVFAGEDYDLKAGLEGQALPEELFLLLDGREVKLLREDDGLYHYRFASLNQTLEFNLSAAGYTSDPYRLEVLRRAEVSGVTAALEYPAYTGRKNESLNDAASLSVPEGTWINWTIQTRHASTLQVDGGKSAGEKDAAGRFKYRQRYLRNGQLRLLPQNEIPGSGDTQVFDIRVIPDAFPAISVERQRDSSDDARYWFSGSASDDYGIARVLFRYRFAAASDPARTKLPPGTLPVSFSGGRDAVFGFTVHTASIGMAPGDRIEYWFEVWDNDAVNGSKPTRTPVTELKKESLEELQERANQTAGNMSSTMEEAFRDLQKQSRRQEELELKLNSTKNPSWEDKDKLRQLIDERMRMQERMEELRREQEKLSRQQQELQTPDQKLLEREKELRKLFEEMASPEMKAMMEKLREMLNQLNKDQMKEQLDKMQLDRKDLEKQLDMAIEQFRQLQVEKKADQLAQRMEQMAEKQQKLAEKTENTKGKNAELQQEQQKLNEELKELQDQQKELERENQELETPLDFKTPEGETREAGEQMQQAGNNLSGGQNQKAAQNQKSAAQKLQEAADKMRQAMSAAKAQQDAEDYQTLRQILENLVEVSFSQEKVMQEMKQQMGYSPRYVQLSQEQKRIVDEMKLIEDSLFALSKRQPRVKSFINKEVTRINDNLDQAIGKLRSREQGTVAMRQQYAMTGMNNLAVMLSESLSQMQQDMQSQPNSSGKACNNPKSKGKGQPKQSLNQMQEQLGKMLQQMQQQQGNKPGQQGQQQQQQQGKQASQSEQFARMAAQQEALRREVEKMRRELEEQGAGDAAREIRQTEELMKEQEKKLLNKQFDPAMLERHKEIRTRLLEHEKANREQDQDEQRESNRPGDYPATPPPALKDWLERKRREQEMLRRLPPELNTWYREMLEEYYRQIR